MLLFGIRVGAFVVRFDEDENENVTEEYETRSEDGRTADERRFVWFHLIVCVSCRPSRVIHQHDFPWRSWCWTVKTVSFFGLVEGSTLTMAHFHVSRADPLQSPSLPLGLFHMLQGGKSQIEATRNLASRVLPSSVSARFLSWQFSLLKQNPRGKLKEAVIILHGLVCVCVCVCVCVLSLCVTASSHPPSWEQQVRWGWLSLMCLLCFCLPCWTLFFNAELSCWGFLS